MFWNETELEQLKGTSVVGLFFVQLISYLEIYDFDPIRFVRAEKLGKEDAEKDYAEKVVPAIQVHLDIHFYSRLYSLDLM